MRESSTGQAGKPILARDSSLSSFSNSSTGPQPSVLSSLSSIPLGTGQTGLDCPDRLPDTQTSPDKSRLSPSLKTQFERVATWWCWSEEDRTAWAAYAREHLVEAGEFIRLAHQEIQTYIRLGMPSVERMVSIPAPVSKGHAHETR